jgi:hypothetical protein
MPVKIQGGTMRHCAWGTLNPAVVVKPWERGRRSGKLTHADQNDG